MQIRYIIIFGVLALAEVSAEAGAPPSLFAIDWDSGDLVAVSTIDASLSPIGNTGIDRLGGLEMGSDGFLYGLRTGITPEIFRIDPTDASIISLGVLDLRLVREGGLAFSPDGTLFGANSGIHTETFLFSIDFPKGKVTVIGELSGPSLDGHDGIPLDINGLGWRSDGMLIGIESITNSLVEIDPATATVAVLAPLPTTLGLIGGMAVSGDIGYYSTAGYGAPIGGTNALYSFDPFTGGDLLRIGGFDIPDEDTGFSGLAIPEPGTALLLVFSVFGVAVRRRK